MVFTLSNVLSTLRFPLAFLFLSEDPLIRCLAIAGAMMTDWLDGFLARRFCKTSQIGAILDPLMDKFFVAFAIGVFIFEGRIQIWQAFALISRDFAVILFGLYLALSGSWSNFQIQSIWSGKVTTTLQFFTLIGLVFQIPIPLYLFWCFIVLGILALGELHLIEKKLSRQVD